MKLYIFGGMDKGSDRGQFDLVIQDLNYEQARKAAMDHLTKMGRKKLIGKLAFYREVNMPEGSVIFSNVEPDQ